ncbi:MAG: gamma-glutamyl-gamma-aminobutyrate hydrolase family protein [Bacteroidaceae bacterium]|nr:gamma-glutamyl-gamma-aminobutyrate hydrolase family protein [Bacteroidaceae bacterium]
MSKLHSILLGVTLALTAQTTLAQRPGRVQAPVTKLGTYYNQLNDQLTLHKDNKPVIGVSCSNTMKATCTRSIELAGGIPYILPVTTDVDLLEDILERLDGVMMTGGEDVNPAYYNAEPHEKLGGVNDQRDDFELMLFKKASDRSMPIFGVCRGLQLINVAMGGTLIQDIPSEKPSDINHAAYSLGADAAHEISITNGSLTAEILGSSYAVNSRHHQGIQKLAPELKITAWSMPDSIPEAIEAYPIRPIYAVQFHPELNAAKGDPTHLKFFQHLVKQAALYAQAKDIHTRIFSVDTHCDTPMGFSRGSSLGKRSERQQVSIPKMKEGRLDAQFLAAFLSQRELDEASMKKAAENCQTIIDNIYKEVAKYSDYCGIAVTEEDGLRLKAEGKKAFYIGIENGYGIGNDISLIRKYYNQGVNYITLCHSADNAICNSSTRTADENKGLTEFGKKVVKEMNKVGMTIDLSHASMGTFWDVMKLSKLPVICSHSGAKDMFFHDRNLNDDQLRALAKNGGVIQVCIFAGYMSPDAKKTNIDDVVAHIDHCVKVAGIDHVGIGSDFDGGGGVLGCRGSNDMIHITVKLLEKGYTEEQLRKIWGGNFFRVLMANRKAGK